MAWALRPGGQRGVITVWSPSWAEARAGGKRTPIQEVGVARQRQELKAGSRRLLSTSHHPTTKVSPCPFCRPASVPFLWFSCRDFHSRRTAQLRGLRPSTALKIQVPFILKKLVQVSGYGVNDQVQTPQNHQAGTKPGPQEASSGPERRQGPASHQTGWLGRGRVSHVQRSETAKEEWTP